MNNEAKRFHVFVANRIQQIRNSTEPSQWHYVESKSNPADLASRGMKAKDLKDCSLWSNGPHFLNQTGSIPEETVDTVIDKDDPEVKKSTPAAVVLSTSVTQKKYASLTERLGYFSSWYRVKRAVALCLRYKDILLRHPNTRRAQPVTVTEMLRAETTILQAVQAETFEEELRTLTKEEEDIEVTKRTKTVKTGSSLYRLDPFINEKGVICVGGRIRAADVPVEQKHPVVVPRSSHVTKLIIRDLHEKTHHAGRGTTLGEIRASGYWIINGRSAVSKYIMNCVTCKRLRGQPSGQLMADLPTDRLEESAPFTYSSVDYFGPFLVNERRSKVKRWGVLFTCMASRAVHIETANSLTTDAFLNAYRRFVCRRGTVAQLRCDQGTNFIGGKRVLEEALNEMNEDRIQKELLKKNCDWIRFKFNPPKASHIGGAWERLIRSTRSVLEALLLEHGSEMDDEVLRTLLTEIEMVINSRPFTYPSMHPADTVEPLTVNQLLTQKCSVVLPPPGRFPNPDLYSRQRWRKVQHAANQFWSRWRRELLLEMQYRAKWQQKRRNLTVGDIVAVVDDDAPRCRWPLGRVVAPHPAAADGLVRRVLVKIGDREYERPVHRLIPLVVPPDDGDSPGLKRSQGLPA